MAVRAEAAGLEAEASIVAALAIWPGVTLLGTLVLGAIVTLRWRWPARKG